MSKPPQETVSAGTAAPPEESLTGKRPVYFNKADGFVETRTFARGPLLAGNRIEGPALVEEHASTTVVMPGDRLEVDRFGNLVLAVGDRA